MKNQTKSGLDSLQSYEISFNDKKDEKTKSKRRVDAS